MPVPGPPPGPQPPGAQPGFVQPMAPRPPVPGPPVPMRPAPTPSSASGAASAEVEVPALEEVRMRLDALDEVPLEQHPEQFTAVDSLLRSALDGTDRALRS